MAKAKGQAPVHPVGIDLGTTYSCLSYLTPQGQPVTLPNSNGELSTPSVVLFEQDEAVVGTEALRHSIAAPERVVSHVKRWMGDPNKCWMFEGRMFRPKDVSALIIRQLLDAAEEQLGRIRHAVITVPAQFSELQRQDTIDAGLKAGLERVDIINEPVAAALCYVLGEGMWFVELANTQTVMVFDLGGGTFDLSLVNYNKHAVRVIASGGDLRLGGLDWNRTLEGFACDEFVKESISDPRLDRESMQALAIEVEQVKRSLSVRTRSTLVVQHDGRRKTYMVDRDMFELLTRPLVDRTEKLTREILKANKLGWADVDAMLITGGATRMPMIRRMLQRISGTTLNQTLSPDQSISHGAAYYAGMLLSGRKLEKSVLGKQARERLSGFQQQSVTGRALGILVRDMETGKRNPHFLIPANTPLPCAFRQRFGTVVANQKRVHLYIVESGTSASDPPVELGECVIDGLPDNLPLASPVEVTIRYDEQVRVHVEAVDVASGRSAQTTIVRPAPAATDSQPAAAQRPANANGATPDTFTIVPPGDGPLITLPATSGSLERQKSRQSEKSAAPLPSQAKRPPVAASRVGTANPLSKANQPVPLCDRCGNPLDHKGRCRACHTGPSIRPVSSQKTGNQQKLSSSENNIDTEEMVAAPKTPPKPPVTLRKKP